MATLVLGAAGALVGGVVGRAVGAVLGYAIDSRLLAPRARSGGGRLADLKVQGSSYGAALPHLWGRTRVAGQVIWSTDLKETRGTTGGGKGRPKTETVSYSASFAVALSGRRIAGVGRIWADGKLLRGAAGDFKVATGFRLHTGAEGQAPDPLIASLEGEVPAYRGIAYAVFEDMALAEFGNRLPSLSFEVLADPAALGAVLAEASGGAVTGTGPAVEGLAVSEASAAALIETLRQAWPLPLRDDGTRLSLDAGAVVRVAGDVAERRGAPGAEGVALGYADPARDYQPAVQRAGRAVGRVREGEVGATLAADEARALAEGLLLEAGQRTRLEVTTGWSGLAIAPGQTVRVDGRDGGRGGLWRVTESRAERMRVTLTLVPVAGTVAAVAAEAGRAVASPDRVAGQTRLVVAELPPPLAREGADFAVLANGSAGGWRSAALLIRGEGEGAWADVGASAAPAVLGTVAAPLPSATPLLADWQHALEVTLARADLTLGDADEDALAAGANVAVAGGEWLQFARAEQVDAARWRLTGLRRGWGGSATGCDAGAGFALWDEGAARRLAAPPGTAVAVMASGIGDDTPVTGRLALTGLGERPLPPVHLRVEGDALRWVRQSRDGWRWRDGADAPLAEEREGWSVEWAGGVVETNVPELPLGSMTGPVAVRQLGTDGRSDPAIITVGGE